MSLPSGLVWVVSGYEKAIRVFDSTARLVETVGRKGSGPGEFRTPRMIGQVGDSIWTWDVSLSRITVFLKDGRLVRSVTVPLRGDDILLRGGAVGVFTPRTYGTRLNHNDWMTFRLLRGNDTTTLFRAAAAYREFEVPMGGGALTGRQPFDDDPLLAMSSDGSGFAFVDRPSAGSSRESTFRVLRIGSRGDTTKEAA